MKKYGFIVLLLLGLSWAAVRAQQAPAVPSPPVRIGPLRLEKISFSKASGHCDDGSCVTARINSLKVVSAENAQAGAKITAAIAGWVLPIDGVEGLARNPQEVLLQFVDSYWKWRQKEQETYPTYFFPWKLVRTVKVEYQSAQVLSLSFVASNYTGGVHPQTGLTYANFRPATGERIFLTDIFNEGFAAPLNALGEIRFRKLKGLSPVMSVEAAGFWFPHEQFELNKNFSIGDDGLTFYFNDYEIASYTDGPTRLLLPYADIQTLLRPDAGIP